MKYKPTLPLDMKLIYIYNGWNILEMDLLLIEGPTLPQNVKSKSYRHQTSHVSCHGLSRAHAFKGIPTPLTSCACVCGVLIKIHGQNIEG
jgi:hypothetical protein